MSDEINNDGFFSEMSYGAANDLAQVIGPIFDALLSGAEPNWQAISIEVSHRRMARLFYGDNLPDYVEARTAPFLMLSPLIAGKVKNPLTWSQYLSKVISIFPAYNALIIADDNPAYSKEMAETQAFLGYSSRNIA